MWMGWVSEWVYLTSLLNSQGLMSEGPGAGQWNEGWKGPRLEYTGFRTRDPMVWSRVFYPSTKRGGLLCGWGFKHFNVTQFMQLKANNPAWWFRRWEKECLKNDSGWTLKREGGVLDDIRDLEEGGWGGMGWGCGFSNVQAHTQQV